MLVIDVNQPAFSIILFDALVPSPGMIEAVFIADQKGESLREIPCVNVVAGRMFGAERLEQLRGKMGVG